MLHFLQKVLVRNNTVARLMYRSIHQHWDEAGVASYRYDKTQQNKTLQDPSLVVRCAPPLSSAPSWRTRCSAAPTARASGAASSGRSAAAGQSRTARRRCCGPRRTPRPGWAAPSSSTRGATPPRPPRWSGSSRRPGGTSARRSCRTWTGEGSEYGFGVLLDRLG